MKRATANTVVQALTWRLRDLRIRVGLAEIEQAMAILQAQDEWSDTDLEQVLLPIFAKRQEHRAVVVALLGEFLTPPREIETKATVGPELAAEPEMHPSFTTEVAIDTDFIHHLFEPIWKLLNSKWLPTVLWASGAILFAAAVSIAFGDVVRALLSRLSLIARAIFGAFTEPLGNDLISKGHDFESLQIALLVRHAVVSSLAASGTVLILLAFRLRSKKADADQSRQGPVVPRTLTGDGSVFRVGSLGGPPPPFLDPTLASEIVELITYRQTERLQRDLDLRSTVERRVRGDMDSLVFRRRKELPTIVILSDTAAEGRHWNTLAQEFETALEKRGLRVETLPYYGALSRPTSYSNSSTDTVEAVLDGLADRTGWMLTLIFGDLTRFSSRDIAILAAQGEQGPILAFDYADPRLWDVRHSILETKGMGPYPATGYALRQALAAAFAPDRFATRSAWSSIDGEPAFWHLSEPHLEWAIACAMVEPISFSLAEKLRKVHPRLCSTSEDLSFALLTALPESWVSREGLRFAPQIRRELLSSASRLSRELQTAFLGVFDAAFGEEPTAITAGELWRYTRAQAELFTMRQARALQDLADVKACGMIAPNAFDDFVGRLRQPGAKLDAGSILLRSAMPTLHRLSGVTDQTSLPRADGVQFASWSIGMSEVRVRVNTQSSPLAAFFAEGQSFLTVDRGHAEPFSRVDAARGTRQVMTQLTSLSKFELEADDFTQVYIYQSGDGGVLAGRGGRLFIMLKGNESEKSFLSNIALQEIKTTNDLGDDPLVALSPVGGQIAYAKLGSSDVTVMASADDESPQDYHISGALTAIAFSQRNGLLCANANGEVVEFAGNFRPNSLSVASQPLVASFDGEIAVLSDFYSEEDQRYIVAALADGRVGIQGPFGPPRTFELLSWRPRWMTTFPDRKAALMRTRGVGISVAVTGANGEFDIVGLNADETGGFEGVSLLDRSIEPSRDGLSVLAINPQRRRIIVRNGSYLEVRPLVYDLPEPDEAEVASTADTPPEPVVESESGGSVPA